MNDLISNHLFDIINTGVVLLGIVLAIWTVFRQIKPLRVQYFYDKITQLESKITDSTKDVWGIPEDNTIRTGDNKNLVIDLEKLSYMINFLDTYVSSRALKLKRDRPKKYSEYSLIHRMFENKVYRDYWKYIVRDKFYYNAPKKYRKIQRVLKKTSDNKFESNFLNAIEETIKFIENKHHEK